MCIIIEKRSKDKITKDQMRAFFLQNQDGWGIMYNGRRRAPVVTKGNGMTKLWAAYRQLEVNETPAIIHLRMATHGHVNEAMTHPFKIAAGTYMMHNGIIDAPIENQEKSDTWHFAELVLKPILKTCNDTSALIRSDGFRFLLESHAGTSNRIVIMDIEGHVTFNDKSWHTMASGMRVSNTYAWTDPNEIKSNLFSMAYYRSKYDDYGEDEWDKNRIHQPWMPKETDHDVIYLDDKHTALEAVDDRDWPELWKAPESFYN